MNVISCKCDFQFIQTLECRGDADKGEFVTNDRQIWFQKFAQIWFKIYTNRGDTVAGGLFRRRGAAGMQRVPQFAEFANFWNEWKSLIQICCLNYILFASITITLHKFWDISSEMHFVFFIGIICCCLLNSDCSFQMEKLFFRWWWSWWWYLLKFCHHRFHFADLSEILRCCLGFVWIILDPIICLFVCFFPGFLFCLFVCMFVCLFVFLCFSLFCGQSWGCAGQTILIWEMFLAIARIKSKGLSGRPLLPIKSPTDPDGIVRRWESKSRMSDSGH